MNADDRYLSCFVSTRSEIVVPIAFEGQVVGEIDIDSDKPAAFGEDDRVFLERVALLISPHTLVAWDTGGVAGRPRAAPARALTRTEHARERHDFVPIYPKLQTATKSGAVDPQRSSSSERFHRASNRLQLSLVRALG